MMACVLDSAMALAWVLPGERSAATDAILDRVAGAGALVPVLWRLEVANVLLMAERRGRISGDQRVRALQAFGQLPIVDDPETGARAWAATTGLAVVWRLTVYDVAYLELALRTDLPLATLDRALAAAAIGTGVTVLGSLTPP